MTTTSDRAANGRVGKTGFGKSQTGSWFTGRAGGSRGLPTRPRQRGLITVAVLLVVGFALAGALLYINAGQKVSVLAVGAQPVPRGHVITRSDLVSVSESGVRGAIPVDQVNAVVGKTATVGLVPGQMITDQMMSVRAVPARGQALVGLSLDPSRVPSAGLAAGDVVNVVAVPSGSGGTAVAKNALESPRLLARGASVYNVRGSSAAGGTMLVTVVVDASESGRLAAYSTNNQVALVETAPAGTGGGGS